MSSASYQRAWRARHGAKTGQPGRPRQHGCGTSAGYQWHRNHHETPCAACTAAWNQAQRDWYRARRSRQTTTTDPQPQPDRNTQT